MFQMLEGECSEITKDNRQITKPHTQSRSKPTSNMLKSKCMQRGHYQLTSFKSNMHSQVIKYIFSTQYETHFQLYCKFTRYPSVYCLPVKVQGCTLTLKWRFKCDKITKLQSPSLEALLWVMVHQTGGTCLRAMFFSNHPNMAQHNNIEDCCRKKKTYIICVNTLYISPCSKVFNDVHYWLLATESEIQWET